MQVFGVIQPEAVDDFQIDFSKNAGTAHLTPTGAVWTVSVSPFSDQPDSAPASRLIGSPINDTVNNTTTHRMGNMLNGVTYWIHVVANYDDGRVAVDDAELTCSDVPIAASPTLTVEQFRQDLPAFSDTTKYSDEAASFWMLLATKLVNQTRFGELSNIAIELYTAHNLILEQQTALVITRGGIPIGIGPTASRSVGPVSISYDFNISIDQQAGFWNLTIYGQRFWYLVQMAGAGGIQL